MFPKMRTIRPLCFMRGTGRNRKKQMYLVGGVAVALTAAIVVYPVSTAEATESICHDVSVPVTIAPGVSGPIAGTLCNPPGAETLQVVVHGYSYNRSYWDAGGYEPDTYSYPLAANKRGYATLTIDRLGDGKSFRPLSALVNYETNVSAVEQVITVAKRGDLGTPPYQKIVLVGHSYGSLTSYAVAAQDKDVNALVATGSAHTVNHLFLVENFAPYLRPALLDPQFTSMGLDPGYLASAPGNRDQVFVNPSDTDPEILRLNETAPLKDTGTAAELASLWPAFFTNLTLLNESKNINIPVLAINGQLDPWFCGGIAADCKSGQTLAASEKPFFGPNATVEGYVVPNTGHDTTLERTAPQSNGAIFDFIDRYVGAHQTS